MTTVLEAPPSTIVVVAPAPITFKLLLMMRFSVYVAAATMIVSPDDTSEIACPMVLQAVVGEVQLLLLSPFTPSTYHVVLAMAVEAEAKSTGMSSKRLMPSLHFMMSSVAKADATVPISMERRCSRNGHPAVARLCWRSTDLITLPNCASEGRELGDVLGKDRSTLLSLCAAPRAPGF